MGGDGCNDFGSCSIKQKHPRKKALARICCKDLAR